MSDLLFSRETDPEKRVSAAREIIQPRPAGQIVQFLRREGPPDGKRSVVPGDPVAEGQSGQPDPPPGVSGAEEVADDDSPLGHRVAGLEGFDQAVVGHVVEEEGGEHVIEPRPALGEGEKVVLDDPNGGIFFRIFSCDPGDGGVGVQPRDLEASFFVPTREGNGDVGAAGADVQKRDDPVFRPAGSPFFEVAADERLASEMAMCDAQKPEAGSDFLM